MFLVHQRLRNDADNASARACRRLRHGAHQAAAATTIDELTALRANPGAHDLGRLAKQRVFSGPRAAVHTH